MLTEVRSSESAWIFLIYLYLYLLINYKNFSLPKIFLDRTYPDPGIGLGPAGIRISVRLKLGEEKK